MDKHNTQNKYIRTTHTNTQQNTTRMFNTRKWNQKVELLFKSINNIPSKQTFEAQTKPNKNNKQRYTHQTYQNNATNHVWEKNTTTNKQRTQTI